MKLHIKSIKNLSVSVSLLFHIILVIAFLFFNFTIDHKPKEYIELSFGTSGLPGSSGNAGTQINQPEELPKQTDNNNSKDKSEAVKDLKSAEETNTSAENVIRSDNKPQKKTDTDNNESKIKSNGFGKTEGGNKGNGSGSFGYDIDWGGLGQRKIYSFSLPEYPEGVNKEIDIRLRFTILPDGTVGNIFPLIKADTRLENAAIHSLRQWRFEPLDHLQKQTVQVAVIVFPYRLK